jgi:hypothetical protein
LRWPNCGVRFEWEGAATTMDRETAAKRRDLGKCKIKRQTSSSKKRSYRGWIFHFSIIFIAKR